MAEPFANERKSTPKIIMRPDSNLMFFLSLANGSTIGSSKSEFEQKKGSVITVGFQGKVILVSIHQKLMHSVSTGLINTINYFWKLKNVKKLV